MLLFVFVAERHPGVEELVHAIDTQMWEQCPNIQRWCIDLLRGTAEIRWTKVSPQVGKTLIGEEGISIDRLPVLLELEDDKIVSTYYMDSIYINEFDLAI